MSNQSGADIAVTGINVNLPDGRRFACSWRPKEASGAPILLLHDSLGSVELWRDFPEALARHCNREVIAYDRLGYGRSDPNPELPSNDILSGEVAELAALLSALKIERFAAFGHSIGAEMSVACGARLPERCVAVIAESAQTWIEDQTLATITSAREQFSDPERLKRLQDFHGDKAQWVLDAWTETWLRPSMRDWTIAPELPNLRCPLLVIHGDRDEFTSLDQPRRMAELAGGPARLEILPDCGHIPHRERMDDVLRLVADFLREL